uniref:WKF domain-containing protein n=1 Tax=Anopheles merus TaxID=30066 RepID=A0A182VFS3_ANOME
MVKKNQIKAAQKETKSVAIAEKSGAMQVAKRKGNQQKRTENGGAVMKTKGNGVAAAKPGKKMNEKPNKKQSAQSAAQQQDEDDAMGEKTAVPAKVSKKAAGNGDLITGGTTIDQVAGINLQKKTKKSRKVKQREKLGTKGAKAPTKSNEKLQKEALEYLDTWGKNRQEWKFSKLKQIYIQEHVFDDSFIGEEAWPIAVEYLSKTQGFARDLLTAKAKAIIKKGDVNMKVQDSANYKRARELLQCLG